MIRYTWDTLATKLMRTMQSRQSRVGSLILRFKIHSLAYRDNKVHHNDVCLPHHHVAAPAGHTHEVCGLRWSRDGRQLYSAAKNSIISSLELQSSSGLAPRHILHRFHAALKAPTLFLWQKKLRGKRNSLYCFALKFCAFEKSICG